MPLENVNRIGTQVFEELVFGVEESDQPENLSVHQQTIHSPRYIDAPILRDRDADANSGTGNLGKTSSGLEERLYYLTDANMNVTCLIDTTGDAVERYWAVKSLPLTPD